MSPRSPGRRRGRHVRHGGRRHVQPARAPDRGADGSGRAATSPDRVIVVDNASGDGTAAMVRDRFPDVDLLELPRNIGGAGGFSAGMARALAGDPGLLWLLDDDTVPEPGALRELLAAWERAAGQGGPDAAGQPGRVDRRPRPSDEHAARQAARDRRRVADRRCGGMRADPLRVVRVRAGGRRDGAPTRAAGRRLLPVERRLRVHHPAAARAPGLLCPDSVVVHKTKDFGGADADPGDRFYYEVRNKIWLFTGSPGLAPAGACCTRVPRCAAGPAPLPDPRTGRCCAARWSAGSGRVCPAGRRPPRCCCGRSASRSPRDDGGAARCPRAASTGGPGSRSLPDRGCADRACSIRLPVRPWR